MTRASYTHGGTAKVEAIFDSLYHEAKGGSGAGVALDSVRAKDVAASYVRNSSAEHLPAPVQGLFQDLPENQHAHALDSVLLGMSVYEKQHGVLPTADVIEAALSQGRAAVHDPRATGALDSVGTTAHHDAHSAQPRKLVVAITAAIAEAIPFATYLPADIDSNEARLGIVSHLAGSEFGDYLPGNLMDGINVGGQYFSGERRIALTLSAGRDTAAGKISSTTGGAGNVPLLRGRTLIFVDGFPVAGEPTFFAGTAAVSQISGTAVIGATNHAINGTVNVVTGDIALTFNPALPENTAVDAEGYIDYETAPDLAPEMVSQVVTYSLYATASRAIMKQTIDSKTQYAAEIGLDLLADTVLAARNQHAMERHYSVIRKALALAKNNTHPFNFNYAAQIAEKSSMEMLLELMPVMGVADQQMANNTMDHGITHLYVQERMAAIMASLPRDVFEPSGLSARPGIYRLGRLFGRYEVYYTPKGLAKAAGAEQILCVGRSQQVARCPFVLGDAVPPTVVPLAVNGDLRHGAAIYSRSFTQVNPHRPSAMGAALINVTGLGI